MKTLETVGNVLLVMLIAAIVLFFAVPVLANVLGWAAAWWRGL